MKPPINFKYNQVVSFNKIFILVPCFNKDNLCLKEIKTNVGHKGEICNGTISKNCVMRSTYLYGKFHAFMKKCTIFALCCYTKSADIRDKTSFNRSSHIIHASIYLNREYLCSAPKHIIKDKLLIKYYYIYIKTY